MATHGGPLDDAAEAPTPEPEAAAAIAMALGRGSAKLAPEAVEFLRKSSALLDLKMEHLHEERDILQRHRRVPDFSDRLRVGLQLRAVGAGLALAIGLGAVAWSAHKDRSLVVEAFAAPPELEQRGLDGRLLANLVLDRLNDMEAHAQSVRAPASYVDSWSGESRVEIPQTGISINELDRLLNRWLGHQTHITGDAYLSGDDLVVAARIGNSAAHSFSGPPRDADALAKKAAEAVYAETQPYRYATFLNRTGRSDEAMEAYSKLAEDRGARTEDRAWAYAGVGNHLYMSGDLHQANKAERQALQLAPDLALARHYLALTEVGLGHDQTASSDARQGETLYARRAPDMTAGGAEYLGRRLRALDAELTGDYSAAASLSIKHEGAPDYFGSARVSPCKSVQNLALAHDVVDARRRMVDWNVADDAAAFPMAMRAGMVCLPGWSVARTRGDWAAGLADLVAADQAAADAGPAYATLRQTGLTPWLAFARMKTGDVAGAQALIDATPVDCYLCLRVRGAVAEAAHDRIAADGWFAQAAQAAPSLPFAYLEHGEALLARGDLPGAAAQFSKAHNASQAFADPLEAWGETLARESNLEGAIEKYREAAAAAPHWGRPHLLWGEALARLGRQSEAAVQMRLAQTLG